MLSLTNDAQTTNVFPRLYAAAWIHGVTPALALKLLELLADTAGLPNAELLLRDPHNCCDCALSSQRTQSQISSLLESTTRMWDTPLLTSPDNV